MFLFKYNKQKKYHCQDTTSLSQNKISVFCVDGAGALWIGTHNGGLNAFNRESETFTRYRHDASNPNSLSDNHVKAILADVSGALWIATFAHALDKFDPRTATFSHYLSNPANRLDTLVAPVTAIYASPADSGLVLWLGTKR